MGTDLESFTKSAAEANGQLTSAKASPTPSSSPSDSVPEIKLETVGAAYKTGLAGSTISLSFVLTKDSAAYAGETLTFSIRSGTGGTLSQSSATTDADGQATVSITTAATAKTYEVQASWNSNEVEETVTVATTAPSISLSAVGSSVKTGTVSTTFTSPLKIQLLYDGAPFEGETISYSISSGTGGSLSAASATTDSNGYAQVSFTAGASVQTYEIIASWNSGEKTVAFTAISSTASTSSSRIIKILQSGAGATSEVGTETVDLNSGILTLKAALFDFSSGTYVSDVAVNWAAVGGGFNSSDFSTTTTNATTIVFSPTRSGATVVQATYMGGDTAVIGPVDTTGTITVTQTLVPGIIQRIAGNAQSQIVNDVLTTPLKVRILTNTGTPIPGIGINFTATLGGGTIVTPQPVTTDANGYATSDVQLSTAPGAHTFRATVASDATIYMDFSATASVGAPHHLAFSTQPSGANAGNPFTQQPVVQIKDEFNNTVTSVPTSVTIARGAGSGTLSGTLTMTSSSGIVSFTDLAMSTQETGVTLVASATSLTSATSSSFNVSAFLGSCATNDGSWNSTQGGCKDLTSGLVWSERTTTSYTWHESIWDASVGTARDSYDYGRSNDYETSTGCVGTCDISTTDYCHNLAYNGYNDWRMPTISDYTTAASHGASTHIADIQNVYTWSSTTGAPHSYAKTYNFSTSAASTSAKNGLLKTYCVRGGWSDIARVKITGFSNWVKVNQTKHGIALQLLDGDGNFVNRSGVTVAIDTNTGTMSGTKSGTTEQTGKLVLSEWSIDTTGSQTITASSTGLLSWTESVTGVSSFAHNCQTSNSRFATADGGCKDLTTNLVWSNNGGTAIGWSAFIWDSTLTGNAAANSDDESRVNDYLQGTKPSTWSDGSVDNYCKDLNQGGATNWRAPTYSEMVQVLPFANTYFGATLGNQYWSSSSCWYNSANNGAITVRLSDGALNCDYKDWGRSPICVRTSPGVTTPATSHSCTLEDSSFATQQGGCKDLSTGLVWSRPTPTGMGWDAFIWDSTLSGNAQPDAYDGGQVNDYTNNSQPTGWTDGSLDNYCHDLVESGYYDWRAPTYNELVAIAGATKGNTHFASPGNQFWSGSSCWYNSTNNGAITVRLSDGAVNCDYKAWGRSVMCVRSP